MNTGESMVLSEGENRYEFDWDVSGLIPGKYMLGISLVEKNSWGNEQILEMLKLNQEYGDMDIIERKV